MREKKVKVTSDFFTKIPYERFEEVLYILLQTPRDLNPWDKGCRMGIPAIFWGMSGIGKSERIEAVVGGSMGMTQERLLPVSYPPENFVGVPVIVGDTVRSEVLIGQIRRLIRGGVNDAVLVIDEASDADRLTQGAMQPLILDRVAGDDKLPPGVRVVLLANPPEYSAGGYELVAALANRMGHFMVPVEESMLDSFCEHIMDPTPPKLIPFKNGIEAIKDGWQAAWSGASAEMVSFHQTMRSIELLHNQPKAGSTEGGGAWPSPRTWKTAFQCIAALRCLDMDRGLEPYFLRAFIGEATARQYEKWSVYRDLPTPKDILTRKAGWDLTEDTRPDKVSMMCRAVASYVVAADKQGCDKLAAVAFEWIGLLCDLHFRDVVVPHCNWLSRKGVGRKSKSEEVRRAAKAVVRKLGADGVVG